MRIAVCSSNGVMVDEPFGFATYFYIYETERNALELKGMRLICRLNEVVRLSDGEKFRRAFELIRDCGFLFTGAIEPEVRRWLEAKKLTVVTGHRHIAELGSVIKEFKKKELLCAVA